MKPTLPLLTLLLASLHAALPAAEITVGPSGFKTIAEGVAALKAGDEPPPTPGLRREGSRGVEKGNY